MMRNVQVQPAVRQRMAARARSLPKFSFGWLVVYIIMIALVAFMALPMIYVVCTAFKPLDELFIFPPQFFVRNPTSQNFVDLMSSLGVSTVPFLRYVLNSLVVTVSTVSLTCLVCSAGAYGMVVYAPTGSKFLFNLVVSALMFSPHVTQIPRYIMVWTSSPYRGRNGCRKDENNGENDSRHRTGLNPHKSGVDRPKP